MSGSGAHSHIEWLDLVNEQDEVVGVISRADPGLRWEQVRVVNAFVRNSRGELWIPRRSASKSLFPNALDVSVGGAVQSDESYLEAFRRETAEEINLDLNAVNWCELAAFSPYRTGLSSHMRVYEIQTDTTPDFNLADFTEAEWLTPRQLLKRIHDGAPAKGDLPELIRQCYAEEIE